MHFVFRKTRLSHIFAPYALVFIAVLLFFCIRFSTLTNFNLTKDERDLFISTYSIAHTGNDIYGNRYPIWLHNISPKAPLVSVYYGVLAWKILPSDFPIPLTGRIIYTLPLLAIPFLIYHLINKFSRSSWTALITSLVVISSPWFYHLAGFGFEAHLAYALLFAGLFLQLRGNMVASLVLYSLSFFSYQGIRPALLVVPIITELAVSKSIIIEKKHWLKIIVFIAASLLLVLTANRIEPVTQRSSEEILFLNSKKLTQEVDFNRHLTGAHPKVAAFFDNKLLLIGESIWKTFLLGINPSYLFGTGDYTEPYTNGVTGQFLPIFFPFLIIGFVFILRSFSSIAQHKWLFVLFAAGIIPSVINVYSVTFSVRSFLTIAPFAYCIAQGIRLTIVAISSRLSKGKYVTVFGIIFCIMLFQVGCFLYVYHLRSYQLRANEYREDERVLSQIIVKGAHTIKTVYTERAFSLYLTLLSHTHPSKETLIHMQSELKSNPPSFSAAGISIKECIKDTFTEPAVIKSSIVDRLCLSEDARRLASTMAPRVKPLHSQMAVPLEFDRAIAYYYFP